MQTADKTVSSLYSLFHPKSVAIIGASTKDLSIGNVITKNLIHYKFRGPIYPINPSAPEVRGLKSLSFGFGLSRRSGYRSYFYSK